MSVCVVSSMLMLLWWVEEMPCSAWKSLRVVVVVVCVCLQVSPLSWEQLKRSLLLPNCGFGVGFKLALNKSSRS